MAMKPYKRAVAVTGTYTDRQGNEKKRYTNVGTLFQYDDGGFSLKLDSVPVGDGWNGFINFYEIEDRRDGQSGGGNRSTGGGGGGGGDYSSGRLNPSGPKESFSADLDDQIPFIRMAGEGEV